MLLKSITKEYLSGLVKQGKVEYFQIPNTTNTLCNITLPSGFSVQGYSACVDPNSFDKELGENYAFEDAIKKLWELEGYKLKDERSKIDAKALAEFDAMLAKKPHTPDWQRRLVLEAYQLLDKVNKLRSFAESNAFQDLSNPDQRLLITQIQYMISYFQILQMRLKEYGLEFEVFNDARFPLIIL